MIKSSFLTRFLQNI